MNSTLQGRRVLLVDDDHDILTSMQAAIEPTGAVIETATNGNQAVELAERNQPDVIVLDMMLPGRSGFLVLEKLKAKKPRNAKPFVIMITGNTGARHKMFAESLGVSEYFTKPVKMDKLIATAEKLMAPGACPYPMTIRRATSQDVPAVLPMVGSLATLHENWDPQRYDYRENVQSMYDRWLRARAIDPRSVFLVAQREEKLVAFLIGTIEHTIPIYRLEETGFIHDLWVDPTYRNEGVGRQITMLAIEAFRQAGVKQVRLETATANEAARKLFESCGFRVSSIEMLADLGNK